MEELLVAAAALADQLGATALTASMLRDRARSIESYQMLVMLQAVVGQCELATVSLRACVADARRDI